LKGHAHDIRVDGISTFEVVDIKTDLLSLSVDFRVTVPEVKSSAEHSKIDGKLGDPTPVSGEGRSE
jgi:hypothetical protein